MKVQFPVYPLLAIAMVAVCLAVSGCITTQESDNATVTASVPNAADKVEVVHFHPTKQCYSCKTLGAYAEKAINESFQNELASGRLVYMNVDFSLPENAKIVRKYEVTGSSLWIGVYKEGNFTKEENLNVWYKIGNETEYKEYLTKIVRNRLDGT